LWSATDLRRDEVLFALWLALNGLAEWLARGGVPARREDEAQVSASSPRRKGIRRGAKLMFASGVLFPVCLLGLLINHGELMIIPLLIFFASLVLMLYARLFSDPTPPVKNSNTSLRSC
jgi:hypothetical protein